SAMTTHRRTASRRAKLIGIVTAAGAAAAVAAIVLPGAQAAQSDSPSASAAAGFSPYVDTSLCPAYDIVGTAKSTGVKQFNLAFITSGGGCTPKWGGVTDVGSDPVAAKIDDLRAAGGDVRVSFGGASGSELGSACSD